MVASWEGPDHPRCGSSARWDIPRRAERRWLPSRSRLPLDRRREPTDPRRLANDSPGSSPRGAVAQRSTAATNRPRPWVENRNPAASRRPPDRPRPRDRPCCPPVRDLLDNASATGYLTAESPDHRPSDPLGSIPARGPPTRRARRKPVAQPEPKALDRAGLPRLDSRCRRCKPRWLRSASSARANPADSAPTQSPSNGFLPGLGSSPTSAPPDRALGKAAWRRGLHPRR